jgi:hypothetical protein
MHAKILVKFYIIYINQKKKNDEYSIINYSSLPIETLNRYINIV